MSRVRVRGIYATALTERLREPFDIVQPSPPIRRRFDADFAHEEYDAAVETTDDREGVGVHGSAVGAVAGELADVGRDTFRHADPVPRGAVFDGEVADALGGGAVVDLGDREGYLPYGRVDRRVHAGDTVRVQVRAPAPPWADRRPELDTGVWAYGGIATLSTDVDRVTGRGDDATRTELARTTELLGTEVPDGWGVRWERAAGDASIDAMDDALARAVAVAEDVDAALEAAGDPDEGSPRRLVAPEAAEWLWFGRESRFELDADRRAVTTTMAGHHRVKAAHESASAAVDFVEDLCEVSGEFPVGPVVRRFGPEEGDRVELRHGKPDGRCLSLGRGEVTDVAPDEGRVTVRRELSGGGDYDALGVARESGDVAVTKLREGRWWYPTAYRSADGEPKGTYVNVCTPVELFPDAVRYVDLHVDVVEHADGTVQRVDDDELDEAVASGTVSEELAATARRVADRVERALG